MKPFYELSRNGRIGRLRKMAQSALAHYDLDVAELSILSTSFNTIFRVKTEDGGQYVLRINYPNERTPIDIQSEMMWLDALRRETDIPVATPLHTKDGQLLVSITTDGIPETRHCTMFHWINGRTMKKPSLRTIHKIGAVMAQLHNHADTFKPSGEFCEIQYNHAWTFGEPTRIYSSEKDSLFSPEQKAIVQDAIAKTQSYLDKLYQDKSGLRFLHADLHSWNVMLGEGKLHVIDFDDSMWCFPIQDIGISLYYLEGGPLKDQIRPTFKSGYTQFRPWPESFDGEVDTIIIQRTLDLMSLLVAEIENPEFEGELEHYLDVQIPRLKEWVAK
ncbi:MAG: phosphotransferase [Chloroflexota bacterium]